MVIIAPPKHGTEPRYVGLRMTADEYLALEDDGSCYQLINGVVVMSPKPTFEHQDLAAFLLGKLRAYVAARKLGKVVPEVDVRFASDLVYAPDIVFYVTSRLPAKGAKLTSPPDLIVEFLSPATRSLDLQTKREDYEKFGVREYWAIDPDTLEAYFWRLAGAKFVEQKATQDQFTSAVIEGFVLDIAEVRTYMKA